MDYFVVGPRLELAATLSAPEPPWRFAVSEDLRPCGVAVGRVQGEGVVLAADLAQPHRSEGLRLLARVCQRLAPGADLLIPDAGTDPALAADGFLESEGVESAGVASAGSLRRRAGPFLRPRRERSADMEGVYADPFDVPWNFVPREWDVLTPFLERVPRGKVLDLGAGFGKNALALQARGLEVYGVDVSPSAVARCRRLFAQPERFAVGSVLGLPWGSAAFDAVLDVGCLHCLSSEQEIAGALLEIERVLAPGGWLVSRSFTPRPASWVEQQPFVAHSFGVARQRMVSLLSRHFQVEIWREHEAHNYLIGRKPHA